MRFPLAVTILLSALSSGAAPASFFDTNRTDAVVRGFGVLTELTYKMALVIDQQRAPTRAAAAATARKPNARVPVKPAAPAAAQQRLNDLFVGALGVQTAGEPQNITWRGHAGSMPQLAPVEVARETLNRSARVETHIARALPHPYGQHVGAVWTYWTLLARMSLLPLPSLFNKSMSAADMVVQFKRAATEIQPRGKQLFGEAFFAAPIIEVTNRYPRQLERALLSAGSASGERDVPEGLIERLRAEAGAVTQSSSSHANDDRDGDGADEGDEGTDGDDVDVAVQADGKTSKVSALKKQAKKRSAADELATRYRKWYYEQEAKQEAQREKAENSRIGRPPS